MSGSHATYEAVFCAGIGGGCAAMHRCHFSRGAESRVGVVRMYIGNGGTEPL